MDFEELQRMALEVRRDIVQMTSRSGASHIGSALSCVEILVTLYSKVLRVDAENPEWDERDRFIMSKGHACTALYSVLAHQGFFPHARLSKYYIDGGTLAGHVTHTGVPGVEVSTGSLGHGLAISVGIAEGAKRLGNDWKVYALLSDGECDEGSTWEAALLASSWGLGKLTAIVDYNKIQAYGRVDEVVQLEPFTEKWKSFGWDVSEVDGHDFTQLLEALDVKNRSVDGKPYCIIAHTIKGKGISFMENDVLWHYRSPKGEEFDRAMAELEGLS